MRQRSGLLSASFMRSVIGKVWLCQGAPPSSSSAGAALPASIRPGSNLAACSFDSGVTPSSSENRPANKPFNQVRCSTLNGADSGMKDGIGGRCVTLIRQRPARSWP